MFIKSLILSIFLVISFSSLYAQVIIKGKVFEKINKSALAGATVIYHNKAVAITKRNGEFTFNLSLINSTKDGDSIIISYTGYGNKTVRIIDSFLSVELEPIVKN